MFSYINADGFFEPIGCTIYVPTKSVYAYKATYGWSEYAYDIVGYDF